MKTTKQTYNIPLTEYLHYDNTFSYSDYIEIELDQEPKIVKREQLSISRDENDHPIIKYLLIYDNEKVNMSKLTIL